MHDATHVPRWVYCSICKVQESELFFKEINGKFFCDYCLDPKDYDYPTLTDRQKQHAWKDIKAKLLILKMLGKIRSLRKKLRWVHVSNSVEEYAELKCANEALIEVLKMAVHQHGKRTKILKDEFGEEADCLLIPKEEVESVLERYGNN